MAIKLLSVTLNTANLPDQVAFYKALGFEVEKSQVSKGSEVYRAVLPAHPQKMADFEIRIYGLQEKKNSPTPSLQFCFSVVGVSPIFTRLLEIPGVSTLMEPTRMPDGLMAIVKDPDGNSIELVESSVS